MRLFIGPLFLAFGLSAFAQVQAPVTKSPAPVAKGVAAAPVSLAPVSRIPTTRDTSAKLPVWWDKVVFSAEGVPSIHEEKSLSLGTSGFSAYLVDPSYTDLSADEARALPKGYRPGAEPVLHTLLGLSRKRPIALVDIEPYRRNGATGRVERLDTYRLQIVEEHNAVGSHRSANYPEHSKLATGSW